jgi:hypothetical protein
MKKHGFQASHLLVLVLLLGLYAVPRPAAEDIRIVAPYLGGVWNTFQRDTGNGLMELEDSSLMEGLYFQWISPDRYQWNAFVYHSADINYATLWGGHFIFDLYLGVRERGKFVVGTGIEYIRLDMDAGDELATAYVLYDFQLVNNIIVPYLRAGRYFLFGSETLSVSVLPWVGIQPQWVRGRASGIVDPPGPPPPPPTPFDDDIVEDDLYGLAGLNASMTLFHFVNLDLKYRGTFNGDDYFSTVDGLLNVFFTRHWGVSYRFKYSETSSGPTTYHLGGIAFVW